MDKIFASTSNPPPPPPAMKLKRVRQGLSVLPPLSRRGWGPGLIILVPDSAHQLTISDGVPSPLIKWAEEGYTVAQLDASALEKEDAQEMIYEAIHALRQCKEYERSSSLVGLVAYTPGLWNRVAPFLNPLTTFAAGIVYADSSTKVSKPSPVVPVLQHLVGAATSSLPKDQDVTTYHYPKLESFLFATPFQGQFDYTAESLAHTRNLQFLKRRLGGPHFDLEKMWEEHTHYGFEDPSVEHALSTMVQEPYVNSIPNLVGGIGRKNLTEFYRDHFIFSNAEDSELELISRTIGVDRLVDEFIFKFTHDRVIDWLLPGVPPTNLKAEVPMTGVIHFRGDRLYSERLWWDQGTVLRQLGLMPEYLPFPHSLPGGKSPVAGSRIEYRVPVTGVQTAMKIRDRNCVASNEMLGFSIREVMDQNGA